MNLMKLYEGSEEATLLKVITVPFSSFWVLSSFDLFGGMETKTSFFDFPLTIVLVETDSGSSGAKLCSWTSDQVSSNI